MIIVDNTTLPWSDGMTVAELLKRLEGVEFCSVVRVNGQLISSPQFKTTQIPDKANINILPIVAGG